MSTSAVLEGGIFAIVWLIGVLFGMLLERQSRDVFAWLLAVGLFVALGLAWVFICINGGEDETQNINSAVTYLDFRVAARAD